MRMSEHLCHIAKIVLAAAFAFGALVATWKFTHLDMGDGSFFGTAVYRVVALLCGLPLVVFAVQYWKRLDECRKAKGARGSMRNASSLTGIALAAFCMFVPAAADAGPASAVKVVSAVRKAAAIAKAGKKADTVIDGAKAVKNGKKIYRAADLAKDSVRLGKGMLGKLADGVADDVVEECAKLVKSGKPGSLDDVGAILGRLLSNPNLTARERDILLNDAYIRIAQKAGRLSVGEADDAFRLLKDCEGLHTLVRKCCSMNVNQAAGHLYELKQAIAFKKNGFDVIGLGIKYSDGLKSAPTDLDLLVRKGKRLFLVESKHYTSGFGAPDVIRADADSLINLKAALGAELGGSSNITPIFTFVSEPTPLLAKQLKLKGIPYLVGESDELVEALAAIY